VLPTVTIVSYAAFVGLKIQAIRVKAGPSVTWP
jgi:hypothetical protein